MFQDNWTQGSDSMSIMTRDMQKDRQNSTLPEAFFL